MPAYNESQRIQNSVRAALGIPKVEEVIVIDDGSVDGTGQLAEDAGARVLRLEENRGKGAALNAGLELAKGEILLTLDADLGLSALEGAKLLEPIWGDEADLVVGVFPQRGGKSGFGLAKGLGSAGIYLLTGQRVREPLSGQRAIRREILERTNGFAGGFGAEVGLTIDALRLGYRIREVEVEMSHAKTGKSLAGFRHRGRQFGHILLALLRRIGG
jgi:glycosyltransferase involved in cell wall biosynthesis